MKIFLCIAYGHSKVFSGTIMLIKIQGLCQGNGAAPPTWLQISSLLIRVQRRNRHGITIRSPISRKQIHQVGILYVDDTNLWVGLEEDNNLISATYKAQEGANQWGHSLTEVGGGLNASKCESTAHDYRPDGKGGWRYADQPTIRHDLEEMEEIQRELDELPLTVPTGDCDADHQEPQVIRSR